MRYEMDEIIENSFKDYHVKGFDYICLKRSPEFTLKLYFFDGDVAKLPEVVNPHDHRYDFQTVCLAGSVTNFLYKEDPSGRVFNRFDYKTKLNGGDGFLWREEINLLPVSEKTYKKAEYYSSDHKEIHTIRLNENETILCLHQYRDKMSLLEPTSTYCVGNEPPSLSGLYNKFTPDQIKKRFNLLSEKTNVKIFL